MPKKTEKKEGRLTAGKQKGLKTLSKILQILAILAKVCLWIGLVFLVILAIAFPLVAEDVTISKEELSYKSHKIELRESDDKLDIYYKDKQIGEMDVSEKEIVYTLIDEIKERKLIFVIEVAMIVGVVSIILAIYIMGYVEKLFKNINEQVTPFIEENVTLIRKIGYFMIASVVVGVVGSGIMSVIALKSLDFSYDLVSIGEILMVFALAYIFEYGCSLQEGTDAKVYDE